MILVLIVVPGPPRAPAELRRRDRDARLSVSLAPACVLAALAFFPSRARDPRSSPAPPRQCAPSSSCSRSSSPATAMSSSSRSPTAPFRRWRPSTSRCPRADISSSSAVRPFVATPRSCHWDTATWRRWATRIPKRPATRPMSRGCSRALREEGPGTYLITTKSQEDYLSFGEGTRWIGGSDSVVRWQNPRNPDRGRQPRCHRYTFDPGRRTSWTAIRHRLPELRWARPFGPRSGSSS